MKIPDRIEEKIVRIPFSGCWIWMGAGNRYGSTYFNGRVSRAHRVLFEIAGNTIPKGMELMHSCDIGFCVNPNHMSVGTHQENMTDMVMKKRSRSTTGLSHWTKSDPDRAREIGRRNIVNSHGFGEKNNNSKITTKIAEEIRVTHASSPGKTMSELGKSFGIGREQVRKIVKGIVWKS